MGDGKRLKEIIENKGTSVRKVAKEAGISPTTLYTAIQKDSNIRFDFGLQLANVLNVNVNEICSTSPLSNQMLPIDEILNSSSSINETIKDNRLKLYIKDSLYPLISEFGIDNMADFDKLLRSYCSLDDESRQEIVDTIQLKLKYHKDSERAEKIGQIKEW